MISAMTFNFSATSSAAELPGPGWTFEQGRDRPERAQCAVRMRLGILALTAPTYHNAQMPTVPLRGPRRRDPCVQYSEAFA